MFVAKTGQNAQFFEDKGLPEELKKSWRNSIKRRAVSYYLNASHFAWFATSHHMSDRCEDQDNIQRGNKDKCG